MSDPLPLPEGDPALAEAQQLALELGEQAEWDRVHAEAQREGIYTGERFRVIHPAKYQVACKLLAAGLGPVKIAELLRVSHHTIAAVRDGAGKDAVAREKAQISDQARLIVRMLLERAVNEVSQIDRDKIPFWIGVLVDKMQLLDGQATQRIETANTDGMTLEKFRSYLDSLPKADVVDVETKPIEGRNGGENAPRE